MIHLSLSICGDYDQEHSVLRELLEEFQNSSSVLTQVNVYPIPWEVYRQELTSMIIHNRTGDVSQAGAPVASDMMSMNALRPISQRELMDMGGEDAFAPAAWQSVRQISGEQIWSIPWLADPRVFIYWRDLFQQAGVDEKNAFIDPGNFLESLRKLQARVVPKPWGINTRHKHSAIHTISSWVWASKGDFISADGKNASFLEPEALEGLRAYFSTLSFMAKESQEADYQSINQAFSDRQIAVILGNGETISSILKKIPAEMQPKLAVALPFGFPLVGGSNLVVWSGTSNGEASIRLVEFLVGKKVQSTYPRSLDYLPIRMDVLNQPPYTTDPLLQGLSEAVSRGRIFPVTKLSGLLEEHLGNALVNIWATLFDDPEANLEELLSSRLTPVMRRYDNWMD
jgi:ABC-type glycerol-3-phosphate transport system substrate-binding protein